MSQNDVSVAPPEPDRFARLVESITDYAVLMVDPAGRIVSWNSGAERLKGWRAHEIVGSHVSRLHTPEDVRAGVCERSLAEAARGRFADEGWRVRKDGSQFWARMVMTPIHACDGRLLGIARVTRDISDRLEAESAREAAEKALRLGEIFAGVLGHDLRNPLGAIAIGAELIGRQTQEERIRRLAARIASSGARMARMIEQLLDFARLRLGGGLQIEPKRCNAVSVVRQIREETIAARGCEIALSRRGSGWGEWDADRLAQLLTNLLGNAAQHGTPGTPIGLDIDGRDPSALVLEVRNRGRMPEEIAARAFDPFRVELLRERGAGGSRNERREVSRGLGLGLYIASEIVRAHLGTIEVVLGEDSTTLRVRLPR